MTICPRATVPTNSQSASINTETVTTSSGPTRHFSFGCRPAAINPASEPPRRNSLNSNTSRRIFPAWCELKVKSNSGGTSSMWVRPLADWKSPSVRLPRMAALTCSLVGRKLVTLICAGLQKTSVTAFASPVEPQTPQSKECTFLKEKLWLLLAETAASEGKVMAASGRDRSRAQAPNGTNGGAPRAQRERGVGSKLCCRQRPEQMHNSEQPESFVQQDYFYTPWTIEQTTDPG